jgi:hypothetical protein
VTGGLESKFEGGEEVREFEQGERRGEVRVFGLLLVKEAGQLGHGVGPGGFGGLALRRAQLALQRRPQRRVQPQVAVGQEFGEAHLDEGLSQDDHGLLVFLVRREIANSR